MAVRDWPGGAVLMDLARNPPAMNSAVRRTPMPERMLRRRCGAYWSPKRMSNCKRWRLSPAAMPQARGLAGGAPWWPPHPAWRSRLDVWGDGTEIWSEFTIPQTLG